MWKSNKEDLFYSLNTVFTGIKNKKIAYCIFFENPTEGIIDVQCATIKNSKVVSTEIIEPIEYDERWKVLPFKLILKSIKKFEKLHECEIYSSKVYDKQDTFTESFPKIVNQFVKNGLDD